MNINGIIVGAATFLIIGICHPLVIKAEYYIGKKSWWGFLGNRGSDRAGKTGAQGMVSRESQAA